ncbi:MAG: DEAD/DEAH box helicase [Chitinophagaceae bacterium]|nr:DEAD/DEAH box helicase [Chitinophagaceae bacterium]
MTFKDLNLSTPLLNALDDLGYQTPTTIQGKIFSVIMSGRDVCGIAQTGTGKTMAYLLPCLRLWKFSKDKNPQILIMVPTRELVKQVTDEITKLTRYMNVVTVGVFGGVNMRPQMMEVENGCDIVVATPGRLLDLILEGSLKTKSIKRLVIDEVDELFNLGFRTQVNNILDRMPERRQNLLFSATITGEVEKLMQDYFNNPEKVEAAPAGSPLTNIDQTLYEVPNFYTKVNLLDLLLKEDESMSKVMIFVATKKLADDLFEEISLKFPDQAGVIHSNKAQNNRFNTIKNFRDGVYRFIIATDVVARGIDISEVSHVINFDVPEEREAYIHRIGRTGRADRKGISITFMTEKERLLMEAIEELMKYKVPVTHLPDHLEISDVLTDDEKPKVRMRETLIVLPKPEESGGAFHQKLAKNMKVNVKVSHKEKMRLKYGKPKSRGQKK